MDIVESLRRSGELGIEKGAGPHGTNLYCLPLMRVESVVSLGVQEPAYAIQKPNGGANRVSKLHPNRKEPKESKEQGSNKDLDCRNIVCLADEHVSLSDSEECPFET